MESSSFDSSDSGIEHADDSSSSSAASSLSTDSEVEEVVKEKTLNAKAKAAKARTNSTKVTKVTKNQDLECDELKDGSALTEETDDIRKDPKNLNQPRAIHTRIEQQADQDGWPNGPSEVPGLFTWQEFNAGCLLSSANVDRVKRMRLLLSMDIVVNESYGGTGNGAVSLHQQLVAFRKELNKIDAASGQTPLTPGKIVTATSCDLDATCRKVLASLPEDCRPVCIHGDIMDRISEAGKKKLNDIKERVIFQMEMTTGAMDEGEAKEAMKGFGNTLFNQYMQYLCQDSQPWTVDLLAL